MRIVTILAALVGAFAVQPAMAQDRFRVDPLDISGATIEQQDRIDPRDLIRTEEGNYMPKPNARLAREKRACPLSRRDALIVTRVLGGARISPEQWDGLGTDLLIRFDGADGDDGGLVAIFEGFGDENPDGEMRIFYAGTAAFLSRDGQAVIAPIVKAAGCPFSESDGAD